MTCRAIGLLLILVAPLCIAAPAVKGPTPTGLAERLGSDRGICVLWGDREGRQAIELARKGEWTVLVSVAPRDAAAACRALDEAGVYGTRVFVEPQAKPQIGLAANMADAVVVQGTGQRPTKEEILRVLRPGGQALVGNETWTKPFPPGIDDWSHHYRRPDNNPQSEDQLARAPYLTQFVAAPRYAPAPQAAVASGGRIFMAFGNVAWHQREEPAMNTLYAVNGFNGTLLWKRPLVAGIMVDRSTMVATPERLYLADDRSCKVLAAETGKPLDEIAPPAELTDGTFWKWMALEDGVLYALIGPQEPKDPDARWRSVRHGWPWDGISKGYNDPQYAWGFSRTLLALDPQSKRVLWRHREELPIDARSLALKNGRLYFANFGHYLACLDAKSGQVRWRRTAEKDPEVFEAIGSYRPGHGYIGGWKSTAYLKCTDKMLYIVGPQVHWLTALSAQDGQVAWRHAAKDLHVLVRDDALYTIGPQNSPNDTKKLDPISGKMLAEYQTMRRACTRATGTCDSILFRGHEGSGRFDLAAGKTAWISATRPSCHVGVVIAQGHLYWLPWACDCNLQMYGLIACGPAGDFDFDQPAKESERLERTSLMPGALEISSADWPCWRADSQRSGRSAAKVAGNLKLAWETDVKAIPTAPVAAGGLVFLGGEDGIVRALDAASGALRWKQYTGGSVRYPPTLAKGLALVGSDDGWAYSLDAASGKVVWRFRAAPAERKIRVFDKLLSTWPVASGVLVRDDKAYFACGINDADGTHVYCLDVSTGKILWQNNSSGHLDTFSRRGVACQGEVLLDGNTLYLAGGNSVSPGMFDASTGKCLSGPPGGMGTSAPRGRELHLVKNQVRVSGQPLHSIPAMPVHDQSTQWAPAVITAGDTRLELVEPADKAGSWRLVVQRVGEGQPLFSHELPSPPVRYGLAVDCSGRALVTLCSGKVLCFAGRE